MMATIHNEFDKFRKKYDALSREVEVAILASGVELTRENIYAIIVKKFGDIKYKEQLTTLVMSGIASSAKIGGVTLSLADQRWWLKHHFKGDELTLSGYIWKSTQQTQSIIAETMKSQLGANASWNRIAQDIYKSKLTNPQLPKYMDDLVKQANRAISSPTEMKKYESLVRKTQGQIDKLASNNAPTLHLKKSYQNLLNKTKTLSASEIDKAIVRAVNNNSKYVAERLARTEMAKAYGRAMFSNINKQEEVIGYRSVLSSRHKITDICDVEAEADQYGMGAGIFPKDQGPPYPYHSQCMCILEPVYKTEAEYNDEHSTKDVGKYLDDNPKNARTIMGKSNYEKYQKDKSHPEKYIPNYKTPEKHVTELK